MATQPQTYLIQEGAVTGFSNPTYAKPGVQSTAADQVYPPVSPDLADQITAAALAAGENDSMLANSGTYSQTVKPPWIDPPVEFNPIDQLNYIPVPAIGATATVVQFQVPPGYNGIILSYANNFVGGGWTGGSGAIVWQILRDTAAIKGYNNIVDSLGSPAAPTRHPSGFRVFENQIIAIVVKNISIVVAGQLTGGRLLGYFYPTRYEDPAVWV